MCESALVREYESERAPQQESAPSWARLTERALLSPLCRLRCLTAANANVYPPLAGKQRCRRRRRTGRGEHSQSAPASSAFICTQLRRPINCALAWARRTIKSRISSLRTLCAAQCETFWWLTRHKVLNSFILCAAIGFAGTWWRAAPASIGKCQTLCAVPTNALPDGSLKWALPCPRASRRLVAPLSPPSCPSVLPARAGASCLPGRLAVPCLALPCRCCCRRRRRRCRCRRLRLAGCQGCVMATGNCLRVGESVYVIHMLHIGGFLLA